MATARDCALGAAILGGQAHYHAIGGPWWAKFTLIVVALLITWLLRCLRIVFPQDSPDRLAWWRDHGRRDDAAPPAANGHEQTPPGTA